MTVLPVIIHACPWNQVRWLQEIQALPRDGKPLASFRGEQRNAELTAIAREVEHLAGAPGRDSRERAPLRLGEKRRMKRIRRSRLALFAENGPGKSLVRVENHGDKATFTATARVTDVSEQVNNPRFLQSYGLRWRSSGKDKAVIATGATSSLLIASTGETIAAPSGRDLLELLLEGFVDGQAAVVDRFRWHAGDRLGAVTIRLEVAVSSSAAPGAVSRRFVVTNKEWAGILIEEEAEQVS